MTIEVKDIRDIPDWIAHGAFDVGIAYTALDDLRIDNEPLGVLEGLLVMPAGHRLARRQRLTIRDLAGERMVLPPVGNPDRSRIGAAFAAEGLVMQSAVDTAAAFSACQLVARGLGFAIVDPLTARVAAPFGLVGRPITPTVAFPVTCFFPRGRPRSQLVAGFLDAAREVVGSPGTLTRAQIRRNTAGGTSAINWGAGTKYLMLAPGAANLPTLDTDGALTAPALTLTGAATVGGALTVGTGMTL